MGNVTTLGQKLWGPNLVVTSVSMAIFRSYHQYCISLYILF